MKLCENCKTSIRDEYKLCYHCNQKKVNELIYYCSKCGSWHAKSQTCIKENQADDKTQTKTDFGNIEDRVYFPRDIETRSLCENYQNKIYQSIAIDRYTMNYVNRFSYLRKNLIKFSKFRLDFPRNSKKNQLDDQSKNVLFMIDKILNRGKITISSPFVEKEIAKYLGVNQKEIDDFSFLFNHINHYMDWLEMDSQNEERFYQNSFSGILGMNYPEFVLSQVQLSSLCPDDYFSGDQRVDFFVNNGLKFAVVELDGPEHLGNLEIDKKRDNLLMKNGIEVIRIPNHMIDDEAFVKRLFEKVLGANINNHDSSFICEKKILVMHQITHQIEIALIKALSEGLIAFDEPVAIQLDSRALSSLDVEFVISIVETEINRMINHLFHMYGSECKSSILLKI